MANSNSQVLGARDLASFEDATYSKVTWRLMPLLFISYVVAYLDRVNVGFAKLQMLSDLGFSETVYGLGAGIFFIGYAFFEVPSNILLHKVGARKWIARIMITWGILAAGMMFVKTPTSFYVMRFLLGIAEAGFLPGIVLYLTYWYPARRRGKITAMFFAAIPASGALGGPLSGLIMSTMSDKHGLAGWQWMFLIEAIPAIILGVCVLFVLKDRISDANWLSQEQKMMLEHNIQNDNHGKFDYSIGQIFLSGRVWILAAVYFCMAMGTYGISFWLPSIIRASGVTDLLEIGLLAAIPFVTAMIAMQFLCGSADRTGERRWHLSLTIIIGAVGLVFSAFYSHNVAMAMTALSVAALGAYSASPLFWSLPTAFITGAAAAAAIALINSVANIAGFISPYLIGWVKDSTGSTDIALYVLAGVLVLGALLVLTVPAKLVNR